MKQFFLFFAFLLPSIFLKAQTQRFIIPLGGTVNVAEITEDWNPSLQLIEREVKDEHSHNDILNQNKMKLMEMMGEKNHPSKEIKEDRGGGLDTAYVGRNFQGNDYNLSVPNDNELAVSNSGYVMSVMNTNIFKYDLSNDTTLGTTTLAGFSNVLGNGASKYDPKVIYDPEENKFIVVFLAGFSHTSTAIIVGFSETDNPNGVWHLYSLPGNPLNDTSWTDYPMVSLTHDELFITVNLLKDNTSWQLGWKQSIVWQVDKSSGYSGISLNTQLHTDIENNGRRIRNLCPVKGGSQLYGPDMYFVSDRNLDVQNDTFFLVHITDTIGAVGQQLTTMALISPSSYFVPVSAVQPDPADSLATNDARVLGAFLENDRIQFAGNTTDTAYGTSAFYHGVIHNVSSSPVITFQIISDDTACYGYPNLSYAGDGANDHTAIINVLRSSSAQFLGYSAFVTDGNGNYSIEKNVKSGLSWHGAILGLERWGDYSGSQRKYNQPGVVWVNGSYGRLDHKISTWIAELSLVPLNIGVEETPQSLSVVSVYPNPSSELSIIEFTVDHYAFCSFDLLDANGRIVKNLMEEMVKPGVNQFSFSMQPLASGIYFLRILSEGKMIATQKVVKQ